MTDSKTATERVEDVDTVYRERIMPRVELEDVPTREIREWSVLAHSVMEVTGPSPFGMDGSVFLWLHDSSVAQLLDMCDVIDEEFSEVERAAAVGSESNPVGLPAGLTISDDGTLLNWRGENYVRQSTLGDGECENIAKNWGEFECSECGFYADFGSDLHRVRSCPDCGKAVKR